MKVRPNKSKIIRLQGDDYTCWLSLDKRQRWNTGRIGSKVDLKRGDITLTLSFEEYKKHFEKVGGIENE